MSGWPTYEAEPCLAAGPGLEVELWGRVGYAKAWRDQLRLCRERRSRLRGDTLIVCEHPPTITLGRSAPGNDVLVSALECRRRGIAVVRSDRGGRATYHGPGQLVVYPIVDIAARRLAVRSWVALLEDALIETVSAHGLGGERRQGSPGIWVGGRKIASIGLRIDHGTSYHGLSLNCDLDVGPFDAIVTCGVADERVTSLAAEGAQEPRVDAAAANLIRAIARRLVVTTGAPE